MTAAGGDLAISHMGVERTTNVAAIDAGSNAIRP
jgi:hypothetical protein